jgi:hypothetical protein
LTFNRKEGRKLIIALPPPQYLWSIITLTQQRDATAATINREE